MVITIRNVTGIDLHLAVIARVKSIRFRLRFQPPALLEGERLETLCAGESRSMVNCPDGIRAVVDVSGTAIRVGRRREVLEDGSGETHLELTLHLMN